MSSLPKRMTAAFEKAVYCSLKLTTTLPADKTAEGLWLTRTLSLKQTDKGVEAKLSIVLASGPKKSIFATESSAASTEVANPNKTDKDVDAVIDALLDDAQSQVEDVREAGEVTPRGHPPPARAFPGAACGTRAQPFAFHGLFT